MFKTSFVIALLGATLANAQGASPVVDQDFLDWAASNNKTYQDAQDFAEAKANWG